MTGNDNDALTGFLASPCIRQPGKQQAARPFTGNDKWQFDKAASVIVICQCLEGTGGHHFSAHSHDGRRRSFMFKIEPLLELLLSASC